MKKLMLMTALMTTVSAVAQAQNYGSYYPAEAPSYYYASQGTYAQPSVQPQYYQPAEPQYYQAPVEPQYQPVASTYPQTVEPVAKRRQVPEFKQFSIGLDYVMGSTSMVDRDFEIDNPLYGGNVYKGKTSDFEDSLDSLNGNIGWRPYKYLGLEAFYQQSLSDNEVKYTEHYADDNRFAQADYSVKYKAYGIDLIGYYPALSRLDILAAIGVANYDFKAEAKLNAYSNTTANLTSSNPLKMDDSKTAFRFGIGAQLWLSQRLTFRAMYRYTSIGGDYFDDISEVSLGVRYNF